jgi:hypothetical protein
LTIAKRWCAACHVVTSEQKTGSADVPSFADIARRRTNAKALAAFLRRFRRPRPTAKTSNCRKRASCLIRGSARPYISAS